MTKFCKYYDENNLLQCAKQATYGTIAKNPIYCKLHRKQNMKYVKGKNLCKCGKIPNFGLPTDTIPTCCATCKTDKMVDLNNKKCFCNKHAPYFGYLSDTTPTRCNECKLPNMINIRNKKCKCGKSQPYFGLSSDKSPTRCNECKLPNMINIKSKRCDCGKGYPIYGNPNDKMPSKCNECKSSDMVNIISKKCYCGKHIPYFGYPFDKNPSRCNKCKLPNMINIKDITCNCQNGKAIYGYSTDNSPSRCSKCRLQNMINMVNKKCKCGKNFPVFGLPTDTTPTHCTKCKNDNMIDLIHPRCKANETHNIPCDTVGNKSYDIYCTHCFAHLFPNDPRTLQIRKKSKELQVVSHLANIFKGFVHDKPLYVDLDGGCCASKRRIDLRKLIGNTLLCIEIDENQHRGYNKVDEISRYNDLFMDFSGKYIFIRYNPDPYKINGSKKNPKFDTRMKVLANTINSLIKRINDNKNNELIEIHHLFYDK